MARMTSAHSAAERKSGADATFSVLNWGRMSTDASRWGRPRGVCPDSYKPYRSAGTETPD
ncbi:hypothetical protein GCM10010423_58470 [Streptomyces levis]|uniref:Uncharacterized protein n=1 Tax=Streptomyces levis TaxID=285566 RepID=A0ABP6B9X2_9ACTN